MSESKFEFLERMMNDPSVRQRLKNAEERRAYCEEEWAKQEDDPGAMAEAMPEAISGEADEAEAEPEVAEAEDVPEAEDDDADDDADAEAQDEKE